MHLLHNSYHSSLQFRLLRYYLIGNGGSIMPLAFTTGDVARHFRIPAWQVLQTIKRGFLAEPPRLGIHRFFAEEDLPRVQQALERAGYLRNAEVAHAQ
jgi:hypothetical protein